MYREVLKNYYNKFGVNFPTAMLRYLSEEEIIEIINQCINDNKPYRCDTTLER